MNAVNRALRHRRLDAGDVPARAPRADRHRGDVPCGGRLRRVVAARRHEPRRQGVHRVAHRSARACSCCRASPARPASCTKRCSVNPFAVDEFADALHLALSMPEDQQMRRMRALHARVQDQTVYDWAAGILRTAVVDGGGRLDAAQSRRHRQWPPARPGQPRHEHRLAVHAAIRQPVGVCAPARRREGRLVRLRGRRHADADGLRAQHQRAAHRGRDRRMAGSRSTTSRRASRSGLSVEAPARDPSPDPAARRHAARARAVPARRPTTRASRPNSSPIGAGLEIRGGPHAAVPAVEHPARLHRERLSVPHRSPALFRAQLRPADRSGFDRARSIARWSSRSPAGASGRSRARCRRSRPRPCCAPRSA